LGWPRHLKAGKTTGTITASTLLGAVGRTPDIRPRHFQSDSFWSSRHDATGLFHPCGPAIIMGSWSPAGNLIGPGMALTKPGRGRGSKELNGPTFLRFFARGVDQAQSPFCQSRLHEARLGRASARKCSREVGFGARKLLVQISSARGRPGGVDAVLAMSRWVPSWGSCFLPN
jgi:hypothetical protein